MLINNDTFNIILNNLESDEIIRFFLFSKNKELINNTDWFRLNEKFNYNTTYTNSQLVYNNKTLHEGFNQFYNNFKYGIKQIVSSNYHTLILKKDGSLYGSGNNYYGQLGLGNSYNHFTFIHIPVNNIRSVCCGNTYSLIIKNDNTLWAAGYNKHGELELGCSETLQFSDKFIIPHSKKQKTFIQVPINDVKNVFNNDETYLIFKNDNTIWGCGDPTKLGLGHNNDQNTIIQLNIDTIGISNMNIKSVTCGIDNTFILTNDNTLWCSGYNEHGQLGLGHTDDADKFVQVNINIQGVSSHAIKSIFCQDKTTFILTNDDTLLCCGYNETGALGLGHTNNVCYFVKVNIDNVKSVVGNGWYTCILKKNNTLWLSGSISKLGLEYSENADFYKYSPVNYPDMHETTFIKLNIDNVKSVECSYCRITVLKNDDTIWGLGKNHDDLFGLESSKLDQDNIENRFVQFPHVNQSFVKKTFYEQCINYIIMNFFDIIMNFMDMIE
jgi:alpha-tubulin suppressor-like RCC1 family protein